MNTVSIKISFFFHFIDSNCTRIGQFEAHQNEAFDVGGKSGHEKHQLRQRHSRNVPRLGATGMKWAHQLVFLECNPSKR